MATIQSSENRRYLWPCAGALAITRIMGVGITMLDVIEPKEPAFSMLALTPGVTSVVAFSASGLNRAELYLHVAKVSSHFGPRIHRNALIS